MDINLDTATLEDCIAWLTWNDPNGAYTAEACDAEGLPPLTIEEARELILSQMEG